MSLFTGMLVTFELNKPFLKNVAMQIFFTLELIEAHEKVVSTFDASPNRMLVTPMDPSTDGGLMASPINFIIFSVIFKYLANLQFIQPNFVSRRSLAFSKVSPRRPILSPFSRRPIPNYSSFYCHSWIWRRRRNATTAPFRSYQQSEHLLLRPTTCTTSRH